MKNYRKALFLVLFMGITAVASAQTGENDELATVFGATKINFAAKINFRLTQIDKDLGVIVSPAAGFLLNDRLFVGVEYNSLINNYYVRDAAYTPVLNEWAHWQMSYGGGRIHYTVNASKAVNFGFGTLLGWGDVSRKFICNSLTKESPEYAGFNQGLSKDGHFFAIEPAVNLGLNLTQAIKFEATASYRILRGAERWGTVGMNDAKFSALGFALGVQVVPARF
ncbi:MAG TPA: hypothetical protein VFE50_13905 [Cyclobacteriaceae bacterium]|nr:hypothetical protein [Cyclobacteriaceae bacterium]